MINKSITKTKLELVIYKLRA